MSDLPRLLFCCFDVVPGPSATSRRLSEYLKGLSERFQVVVLSVKTPDHPHIEKYLGARLLRVPVGAGELGARLEAFDRAVRRQLESEEYVLVHFFDPFGGLAPAELRDEYQHKLVYDACVFPSLELALASPEPGAERRMAALARRQELFCLASADAVIVGNPLTRDWVTTLGVERELVHVLRAPVDLAAHALAPAPPPDRSPMNVLHLGGLEGKHGLGLLLEAVAHARTSTALRLTVVGPPSPAWEARLRSQAEELGITGLLDLQAPVAHEELARVLATADVGAVALDDGARGRVVGAPLSRLGEYLAAGRPVLAADTPCTRQLVPEDAAVWYRPGDLDSLADALVRLGEDAPMRVRLGQAARAASGKWDGAKIRADLVALYTAVTGAPAPRALDDGGDPDEITQLRGGRSDEPSGVRRRRAARAVEEGSGTSKVSSRPEPGGEATAGEGARLPPIPPVPSFGVAEVPSSSAVAAPPRLATSSSPEPSRPSLVLPPPLPAPARNPSGSLPRASPAQSSAPLPSPASSSTTLPEMPVVVVAAPATLPAPRPSTPTPPPLRPSSRPPEPAGAPRLPVETLEISDAELQPIESEPEEEELLGGDEVSPVDAETSPPRSAINPWLAQLVHGYCPPGSHLFDRPVPPTTTPGRDPDSEPKGA